MVPNSELQAQREYHAIELLRAKYGDRLNGDENTCLFNRISWFELLAHHICADNQLVLAQAEEGSASALLPLMQMGDMLQSLSNWYSFSFAPIFVNASADQQQSLLVRIANDLRPHHKRIKLYPVLEDEGAASQLCDAFCKAGWITLATPLAHNHVLRLNGRDFAAYWASRPGKLRNMVRRKSRQPFQHAIHTQLTQELWAEYLSVYQDSWKPDETHPDLLKDMALAAAKRGALRLGMTHAPDGRAIATQLWTVDGGTALIHKLAHRSDYDRQSPGSLLSHHMFAYAIDHDRVSMIDYGTGDNAYKLDWMEERRPMMQIDCFNPRAVTIWPLAIKSMISRLVGRRFTR
jgi:CelD/BcsL family acetyltransferase involved in cellulose biosynthesis